MKADAELIARSLGAPRRSGNGWLCRCPAHDDRNPSLSVTEAEDGQVLVHCHAGCSQSDVIAHLEERGLWHSRTSKVGTGPTLVKEPDRAEPTPIIPVPAGAPSPSLNERKLGRPSLHWEYKSSDGETLGYIRRFEGPNGKTFRPLTYCQNPDGTLSWRNKGFARPLPLYNLDQLAERADEQVLIVEGEKAVDAVATLVPMMVPVTWPGGAKNAAHADWSAMADRHVYIWPDADPEGERAALEIARQCHKAGAASIRIIDVQNGTRSKGWDAADAKEDGLTDSEIAELLNAAAPFTPEIRPLPLDPHAKFAITPVGSVPVLGEWNANRFVGPPPVRRWLIDRVIPLGVPVMLAAVGGVGKSMLTLKLGLELATGDLEQVRAIPHPVLGGAVQCHGTVVIITAEDDAKEVHRRLDHLDPDGFRHIEPQRLIVVPLPDAGGALTILEAGFERPQITEAYDSLRNQLRAIPDLRLVVLDPLQAFVGADTNKDPAAGQYLCTCLGSLAIETGATVLVTHHFRKQADVNHPARAREAVRGTTALIDGMRCVYALWPADEGLGKKMATEAGVEYRAGRVVQGAVVKANWPADFSIHTYVRDDSGLLRDRSNELGLDQVDRAELQQAFIAAIADAAENGKPYTKTGGNGVYQRRDELPSELRRIGRNRLEAMVQHILNANLVTQSAAKGSSRVQFLDVPGGAFDRGEGVFKPGAYRSGI